MVTNEPVRTPMRVGLNKNHPRLDSHKLASRYLNEFFARTEGITVSPRLMDPASIGALHLNNRIVMTATHLGYCEDGFISDKLVEFYRARAAHRPGLIIVGGCYTERLGMSLPTMIGISRDEHVEGLARLVDVIHKYGVPVAAQLYHAGRYAHSLVIGEQPVSASDVPSRLTRETPRPLSVEEIHRTVENFGHAAARAKRAGFDAVEIIGSAGYLINQFLAPCTNRRTDDYGGPIENRARFPLEVIEAVRRAVGPSLPVLYRMSGEDFVEGGLTLEDNKRLAPMFEEAGVDCFDVTGGWHESRVPQITMDVPRGHYAYLAEGISEVVDVPVIACNRINSPTVAQRILDRGRVHLIGMARAFIADPEVVGKIREGREDEIRYCVGCNQGCLDRVFSLGAVTCAINPLAGFESERRVGPPAEGRVAVVGGGPAGMEAARVLALRGVEVVLYERRPILGGGLRLAARAPGRGEFASYVTYMMRELRRLSVDLRLGVHATAEMLRNEGFDHVICAMGAIDAAPSVDGVESPTVVSAQHVMEYGVGLADRVVVVGGMVLGCYAALRATQFSQDVTIVERGSAIGAGLGRSTRWVVLKMLRERGVKMHTEATVVQVSFNNVVVELEGETTILPADVIVVATAPQSDRRLAEQLRELGVPVTLVGGCDGTGDLLETIHETFCTVSRLEL